MKIGVDLDGPVYRFEQCLWTWRNRGVTPMPKVPFTKTWNFFEEPGWDATLDDYLKWCTEASEAGHLFNSQVPNPGSVEGIKKIRKLGHTVHIMTYRMFPGAIRNTEAFLRKYDIPFDTISWTKDKTLVPVDVMIEDNVDNARALRDAGVIAAVVDRPWNEEWDGIRLGDYEGPREQEWEEFIDLIQVIEDYKNDYGSNAAVRYI